MGFNSAPGSSKGQAPVQKVEEKEELSTVSINDPDILEKLAKAAGCEVTDFPENEFMSLKQMAKEGKDSEWYNSKTGVKFFMDRDGSFTVGNKGPADAIKRAREMGM